ncbi:hypothetical protein TNIN_486371 [Trichonephila inaurata madagascariensis]|uniref:Uncharacterized protein n=1 Tax=Trichonephila inaurata madagascariensis TaxID=2747483 RepID=A0A8X6YF47_9ARAC|nr:hypothetical protein TNIN_486371 [Trichonephila inaurata madagascariensis]
MTINNTEEEDIHALMEWKEDYPAFMPERKSLFTLHDHFGHSMCLTDDREANPLSSRSRKEGGAVQFPLGEQVLPGRKRDKRNSIKRWI